MNQEKIGKFIKTIRKELELTQQELADELGVTNRAVSKWENGLCLPDYSLINDLCKTLKITSSELLSGERLEKENTKEKFEENVMKTIMKNKKLKNKNLVLTVVVAIIFVSLVGVYFGFKIRLLNSYGVLTLKNNLIGINELKFIDEYIDNNVPGNTIYDDHDHDELYKQKNMSYYISEGYSVTKSIDDGAEYGKVTYVKKDSNGRIISTIKVEGYYGPYVPDLGLSGDLSKIDYREVDRLLDKYNIHSIIDLIKYFDKNRSVNIFSPIDKIKMFALIGENDILYEVSDIVEIHTISNDTINGYYNIGKLNDETVKKIKEVDPEFEDDLWIIHIFVTNKNMNNTLKIEYEFEPGTREEQLKELDKFIHSIKIGEEVNYNY
ncbi:MAG: helix-turn-helix transcriptional regulator [Bacilli bacterium]|nr:helix-turn-helix transcriptional regulator [Bacilli bacterium]